MDPACDRGLWQRQPAGGADHRRTRTAVAATRTHYPHSQPRRAKASRAHLAVAVARRSPAWFRWCRRGRRLSPRPGEDGRRAGDVALCYPSDTDSLTGTCSCTTTPRAGGLPGSCRGGSPSWTRGACLNAPTAEMTSGPMTFGHEHRARGLAVVKDPGVRLPNPLGRAQTLGHVGTPIV